MGNLNKKYINISVILIFICAEGLFAQPEDVNYNFGKYNFSARYDTSNYTTTLIIKNNGKQIVKEEIPEWVSYIKDYDFNNDGKRIVVMETFSGGAHCCTSMLAFYLWNDLVTVTDTIFWGNFGYEIKDIDGDGKLEIAGGNDMFAYAFTNYAETRSIPRIFHLRNGKFKDVTKKYKKIIKAELDGLTVDLKEFTDKGFECMRADDDTFNTDAGSVKTILAAIVGCYSLLDETDKGYELVRKVYKCPDRDKYIGILKTDYKLK